MFYQFCTIGEYFAQLGFAVTCTARPSCWAGLFHVAYLTASSRSERSLLVDPSLFPGSKPPASNTQERDTRTSDRGLTFRKINLRIGLKRRSDVEKIFVYFGSARHSSILFSRCARNSPLWKFRRCRFVQLRVCALDPRCGRA